MGAQLAIENPLLNSFEVFEPHKELATKLASMLPDFMTVVLEPNEDSAISRLTISVEYRTTIKLGLPVPDVEDIKAKFLNTFKVGVNAIS